MELIIYGLSFTTDAASCRDTFGKEIKCSIIPTSYYYVTKIQFETELIFGGDTNNIMLNIVWAT